MDPFNVLVLKVAGGVAGCVLLVYVFYRAVLFAKKAGSAGSDGQLVGIALMFSLVGTAIAPTPPREVTTISRESRRDQDKPGDPA